MQSIIRLALAASLIISFSACGNEGEDPSVLPPSPSQPPAASASSVALARLEMPKMSANGTQFIMHSTTQSGLEVMTYALEYDLTALHSRWVAFRFDAQTRARNVSRSSEPFADDTSLAAQYRIGSSGFGRPYDRGHLCTSNDRLYSTQANEQTFKMTNMSPQISGFNQGYWVTLEGLVAKLGRDAAFADTLYVVKGGTIRDHQTLEKITRPNGTRVAVPKYYFMALLKKKTSTYSAIGFWMEHKDYGYSYNNMAPQTLMKQHAVSIDQLEALTGIDFFHNLPDQLENAVEAQCIPGNWKL